MAKEGKDTIDNREIVIRLNVYELRMMMEGLKGHPWRFAHPILLKCNAQIQEFEHIEKQRNLRKIQDVQAQKQAEIKALAAKKADKMFKIKVTNLEKKEKEKKNKKRKKSRR